jgi:hypothetical protein
VADLTPTGDIMTTELLGSEPGPHRSAPHRVAVLALDGVGTFEVALAVQVFAAANDHAGAELYDVAVAGPEGPVVTRTGYATSYALSSPPPTPGSGSTPESGTPPLPG